MAPRSLLMPSLNTATRSSSHLKSRAAAVTTLASGPAGIALVLDPDLVRFAGRFSNVRAAFGR